LALPTRIWEHGPGSPRPPAPPRRTIAAVIGGLALIGLLSGSYYTVNPNEMAGVRRFGTIVTPEPVGPGPHFKLPFVDVVDRLQTSLTVMKVPDLQVYTVDNQAVGVSIGVTFDVPGSAVLHLLYGVGKTGDVDIEQTIQPIIADRAMRVFATQNTIDVSAHREQIAAAIRKQVTEAVAPLFGIRIRDLQIAGIAYSEAFERSVAAAVEQKNKSVAAGYAVETARQEGDQRRAAAEADAAVAVAKAEGDARSEVAAARGRRDAAVLDAQAATATGEAKAHVLQLTGQAVAANPALVEYVKAAAWNGVLPSTVAGGTIPFLGPVLGGNGGR
jgi:modulator of FtsH protease HflC